MHRLEISGLTVDFGGIHALKQVSMSAETGQIVGLIGPNGAGKSTLLNCISGLTKPAEGEAKLNGTDLFSLSPHAIARLGVGRVFQHPEIMADMTVMENLLIARNRQLKYGILSELLSLSSVRKLEAESSLAAESVLELIGLPDCAETAAGSLPYGHRKLLELGRVLLMGASFLLLDEPVAGLNESEIDRMAEVVTDLRARGEVAVILVEHNMGLVSRLCDKVVVLDAGKVIARGTPAQALKDPNVLMAYLGEAPGNA
jgi:branched-chain amino acid transport system ATP-binding protein